MASRASGIAAILLAVLSWTLPAVARNRTGEAGARPAALEVVDQRPAGGEQCIVCRVRVYEGDIVEVLYKGRTFFVSEKMLAEFEAHPEAYFHLLQARGGLFDEAALEMPPMRIGWLAFGTYMLAGLLAGATCAYVALDRGLPAWGWFFGGLAANVLAVAAVLTRKRRGTALDEPRPAGLTKIPTTRSPLACTECGATHHPAATACGGCGRALTPTVEAETARA